MERTTAHRRNVRAGALVTAAGCFGLLAAAQAQTNYQRLKSFGFPDWVGANPQAPLILGSDGALYGTTYYGASGGSRGGTVFRMNTDGSGYRVLRWFSQNGPNGGNPRGGLAEGNEGRIYGTTVNGGTGAGTVFGLNKDGSGFAVLHQFSLGDNDGRSPYAGLAAGIDGALFGTTYEGGSNNLGTVFKLNRDGTGYRVLHHFASVGDGRSPQAGLVQGIDGVLYGATEYGGSNDVGTVFALNTDGSGYRILRVFSGSGVDGQRPRAALMEGSDGSLYGTTAYGGSNNVGTVYVLQKDGRGYRVLRSFNRSSADGQRPLAALVECSDGLLYGTTVAGGSRGVGTVFKLDKDGTGYRTLLSLGSRGGDGQSPFAGLATGRDGALYGTSLLGGSREDYGTIFKLNQDGSGYRVLRSFGEFGGDGEHPQASLVQGRDGETLYGTACSGGSNGVGAVFKLNPDGSGYGVLRSFQISGGDGRSPQAGLVEGSDGALYGTTKNGGSNGAGAVFALNKNGSGYRVVRSFSSSGGDGQNPLGALVEGSEGALYGTTRLGGSGGLGTIFKLSKDGNSYTVLRSFSGTGGDGQNPLAGLVEGSDQGLYGTTGLGGNSGAGTVFRLNKDGSDYRVLHGFSASGGDGQNSYAGVLKGGDGALYGTTYQGGSGGVGTVFKLNEDGSDYRVLRSFSSTGGDGQRPRAALVEGGDGSLYGTTTAGGSRNAGTVFRLSKDGSTYTVLRSFTGAAGDGQNPGDLLNGKDGAFYGSTAGGGDSGAGSLFRLFGSTPVVAITRVKLTEAGACWWLVGGAAGQAFQIQSTTNLHVPDWQVIGADTFGIDGVFQYSEPASTHPARFFRSLTP